MSKEFQLFGTMSKTCWDYNEHLMNVHEECFENEHTTYVIQIPVREHGRANVSEAKARELENLKKFGVFEEVDDDGQDTVGTHWVITKKEPQDGQKTKVKGRLVAKGFQESKPPQSDSPTVHRESIK